MGNLQSTPVDPELTPVSLARYACYFLRLGTIGFGGPIALAGYMQRDLVEERRWISSESYLEGLALAQLAPGPLAAQLAIYLGYVRAGAWGATLAGIAFIAPSFLMVIGLAELYLRYSGLPWMQAVFYGIGASVIAIIAKSAYKLAKLSLRHDFVLWAIFATLAISTAATGREMVWLLLLGGAVAYLLKAKPWRRTPSAAGVLPLTFAIASKGKALQLFLFFTKAGAFVFGSGLGIVPFLYSGVVEQYHWLTERQFLDAVAVAMITPGPVVITSGFVGYLVAGPLGALAAGAGVFVPVYLVVLFVSPYFSRIAKKPEWRAPLEGLTAAATGAIAGAVLVLGRRAIHDLPTALIGIASLGLLMKWKIPEPVLILASAVAGVLLAHYRGGP